MKRQPELVRVAASPEFMLNGVAVAPRSRVFASFPRWTSLAAPSVMEALPDGSFRSYPGDRWNEWRPGASSHDRIVSPAAHSSARRRTSAPSERIGEAQRNHRIVLELVKIGRAH